MGSSRNVLALCVAAGPYPTQGSHCFVTQEPETLTSAGLGAVFSLWTEEMSFRKYHLPVRILFCAD